MKRDTADDLTRAVEFGDAATFLRSKLDWSELEGGRHARILGVYRQLVGLRRRLPQLTDPAFERTRCTVDEETLLFTMRRSDVVVVVNFGAQPATTAVDDGLAVLFETESGVDLAGTSLTLPRHAGALLAPTR